MMTHPVIRLPLTATIAVLLTGWPATKVEADDGQRGFVERTLVDDNGEHPYLLFVPEHYSDDRPLPVVMYLHGAGERGTDVTAQKRVGFGRFLEARRDTLPFLVVMPMCEGGESRLLRGWHHASPDGRRAMQILAAVERDYRIDSSRRILTGWSMGGYGAWSLAAARPDHWSAVLPVAGGGDPETVTALKNVPVWAIHGSRDNVVRPSASRQMIGALRAAGGKPLYSQVEGTGHDVWKIVYDNEAVQRWMLNPATSDAPALSVHRAAAVADGAEQPFQPDLEIANALSLRIDNRMLEALSYSVPPRVPASVLSGAIPDIRDATTVEGRRFSLLFSRISYSGNLFRARIRASGPDLLTFRFALNNINLTIGRTSVRGSHHSAAAGPITIVAGHREPIWLAIDAAPYVDDRRIRLRPVGTRFSIPGHNWYVTPPRGVSTRGYGMTRERVSSALVRGLHSRRTRIEREVAAAAPTILSWIEKQIDLSSAGEVVAGIWPIPVYRPRVRGWAQSVRTDEHGISVMMGISAAAPANGTPRQELRRITASGLTNAGGLDGAALSVGIATDVLAPLSQLLVDRDAAHINVLDIPGGTFADLADRGALARVLPDMLRLPEHAEIKSELTLAKPLTLATTVVPNSDIELVDGEDIDGSAGNGDHGRADVRRHLRLAASDLTLSVAVRTDPSSEQWEPLADFQLQVEQSADTEMVADDDEGRTIRVNWIDGATVDVSGHYDEGWNAQDATIHPDALRALFANGWSAWTTTGNFSETVVPDLRFERTALRIDEISFDDSAVRARFVVPPIRIVNRSDRQLVYSARGPHSGWGGPYQLEAGGEHEYDVPHSLTYRRVVDGGVREYTLRPGSRSEFRVPRSGGPPELFAGE